MLDNDVNRRSQDEMKGACGEDGGRKIVEAGFSLQTLGQAREAVGVMEWRNPMEVEQAKCLILEGGRRRRKFSKYDSVP